MQTHAPDGLLAKLAEGQHGVVARRQLLALGISREEIAGRLANGRLHRLHYGVYAVGHLAVSREGRWMAAVLAGGGKAVLSYRSAAALWGLRRAVPTRIEITVPHSTRSHGLLHRHCARLPRDEVTIRRRIPVTTVSRTLLDLAAVLPAAEFERALREAEVQRLPEHPSLPALLARYPGRRGARVIQRILDHLSRLPRGMTRSSLEDRFLHFAAQAGLPMPETNVSLDLGEVIYEADCLWRRQRLIVELDGNEAHGTRSAFESDRERDRQLQAAHWRVVRITWRQLDDPVRLRNDLLALLE